MKDALKNALWYCLLQSPWKKSGWRVTRARLFLKLGSRVPWVSSFILINEKPHGVRALHEVSLPLAWANHGHQASPSWITNRACLFQDSKCLVKAASIQWVNQTGFVFKTFQSAGLRHWFPFPEDVIHSYPAEGTEHVKTHIWTSGWNSTFLANLPLVFLSVSSVEYDVIEAANGSVKTAPSCPAQGPKKRGTFCSVKTGIGPFWSWGYMFPDWGFAAKATFLCPAPKTAMGTQGSWIGACSGILSPHCPLPWLLAPALCFLRRHVIYSFV